MGGPKRIEKVSQHMDRDGDSICDSRYLLFSRVDSEGSQRLIFIQFEYKNIFINFLIRVRSLNPSAEPKSEGGA